MLEQLVFSSIQMPGETARIAIALLGTAVAAYYDIFNNKNVPNNFLYAFLAIAIVANVVFFSPDVVFFGAGTAVVVGLIGYLLYKTGQLGAADVLILASLALLLPLPPSFARLPFNFPFIAIIFIFASVIFSAYSLLWFGSRIAKDRNAKPDLKYLLLLIPYAVFVYLFLNSPVFSPVYFGFVSLALIAAVFVMTYRSAINGYLVEEVPLSKVEAEEVIAVEMMDKALVAKHGLKKLLTAEDLEKLKKAKVKTVPVYTKLPPFVPFLLAGILLALVFGKQLLYF